MLPSYDTHVSLLCTPAQTGVNGLSSTHFGALTSAAVFSMLHRRRSPHFLLERFCVNFSSSTLLSRLAVSCDVFTSPRRGAHSLLSPLHSSAIYRVPFFGLACFLIFTLRDIYTVLRSLSGVYCLCVLSLPPPPRRRQAQRAALDVPDHNPRVSPLLKIRPQ